MLRCLRRAEAPDVYHLHGTWLKAMHYGAVVALQQRRPYILHLMGMYEPWNLRQKEFQKRVVRWWFQDNILRHAACLHVNSLQEADQLRKLGFKRPIAVIPVGVDLKEIALQESALPPNAPWKELTNRPFILYLSRIHIKKGVEILLRTWARYFQEQNPGSRKQDWMLVLAGTGEPAYVAHCKELAAQLGIAGQCLWLGHVNELQKSWLFTNAHCFILPTSSENFGNVVAEALGHETPTITTKHTPWTDLTKYGCGWLVDNTVEELGGALKEALQMDDVTRQAMGKKGKELVRDTYSLELACRDILSLYDWVTGAGPKPECVI